MGECRTYGNNNASLEPMSKQDEQLRASIKQEITSYTCEVCDKCADAMTDKILAKDKKHFEHPDYDPQAEMVGRFLELGWIPPGEQKGLDRPDREKIAELLWNDSQEGWIRDEPDVYSWDKITESDRETMRELADKVIALFPDGCANCDAPLLREGELYQKLEEAKKQEAKDET